MNKDVIQKRVDELGRVAIPKELRRELGIEENDMLTVSIVDGKIVLEPVKTSITDVVNEISDYMSYVSKMLEAVVIVTDLKHVVSGSLTEYTLSIEFVKRMKSANASMERELIGFYPLGCPYVIANHENDPYVVSYIFDEKDNVVGSAVIFAITSEAKVMVKSVAELIEAKLGGGKNE